MPKLNTPSNISQPVENEVRKGIKERYHRTVPMLQEHEGQQLFLPMVILSGTEDNLVATNAFQDTLKIFKGKAPKIDEPSNWNRILEVQTAYWTVFYATRTPGDLTKKWFLDKGQVEEEYNWDLIDVLMNDYITIRVNQPHLVNLDKDDPNSFQTALDTIKRLGADGDFFLNGFTTQAVNELVRYLIKHPENLQNTNGSSGTL